MEFSARADADVATTGSTLLPWVPRTTSAVALRLMVLDSALFYNPDLRKQNTALHSTNKLVWFLNPFVLKKTLLYLFLPLIYLTLHLIWKLFKKI